MKQHTTSSKALLREEGADYWRERAEEARVQASQMRDPTARCTRLALAENYGQLAEQAERIRKIYEAPIKS